MAQSQFVDAFKLFLDTADSNDLDELAARLKPYRIASLQVQRSDGSSGTKSMPVVVLDGQATPPSVGSLATQPTPNIFNFDHSLAATPLAEQCFDFGLPWTPPESCHPGEGDCMSDLTSQGFHDSLQAKVAPPFQQNGECQLDPFDMILENPIPPPNSLDAFFEQHNQPLLNTADEPEIQMNSDSPSLSDGRKRKPTGQRRPRCNSKSIKTEAVPDPPFTFPSDAQEKATFLFHSYLRRDYLDFMRSSLVHWAKEGLWMPLSAPCPLTGTPSYDFLRNLYSCVSQLDTRIEADQVRKRVALALLHTQYEESYADWKSREGRKHRGVMGVGRGDMTLMIDDILEQTTPNRAKLSSNKRLQARALFHERKRYGKRWSVLRDELGSSILLICSPKLANMVSNTKVTMASLKWISRTLKECVPIMSILTVLEPLAVGLVNNDRFDDQQTDRIVEKIEMLQRSLPVEPCDESE